MKIASLVVRILPRDYAEVRAALVRIPGVELHGFAEESGRIILTVEDGDSWAVTDSILAVNLAPKVQGVTLAYEYTDDGLELTEA